MFNIFSAHSVTRKQYWLTILAMVLLVGFTEAGIKIIVGYDDELVHFVLTLAMYVASFRLMYLRAVDVGYAKPGQMTACSLIPFVGLVIATLPTGSRTGSMLPCWPSTQKRWAEEARARGMRLA